MKNTTLYSAYKVMEGVAINLRDDVKQPLQIAPQNPELYNQNQAVVFNPVLIGNSEGPQVLMWLSEETKKNRTSTYICYSTDPRVLDDSHERKTYLDNVSCIKTLLPVHTNEKTRQTLVDNFVENIRFEHASRAINSRRDLYSDSVYLQ